MTKEDDGWGDCNKCKKRYVKSLMHSKTICIYCKYGGD